MKREPVIIINAIVAVIEAAIFLLVGLDIIKLSEQNAGLVMAFVFAVAELAKILFIRKKVTPVADPRDNQGRILKPEQI